MHVGYSIETLRGTDFSFDFFPLIDQFLSLQKHIPLLWIHTAFELLPMEIESATESKIYHAKLVRSTEIYKTRFLAESVIYTRSYCLLHC